MALPTKFTKSLPVIIAAMATNPDGVHGYAINKALDGAWSTQGIYRELDLMAKQGLLSKSIRPGDNLKGVTNHLYKTTPLGKAWVEEYVIECLPAALLKGKAPDYWNVAVQFALDYNLVRPAAMYYALLDAVKGAVKTEREQSSLPSNSQVSIYQETIRSANLEMVNRILASLVPDQK